MATLKLLLVPLACALLAVCGGVPPLAAADPPIRALIVTGQNNHNWRETTPHLRRMLEATGRFVVEVTEDPATDLADAEKLKSYGVLVLNYNGPRWGSAAERAFLEAVRGGVGVSVIHAANNAFPGWTEYEQLIGMAWRDTAGHGRYHEFDVRMQEREHPVTRGMADLKAHPDELYHRLTVTPGERMTVLAVAFSDPETGGTGRDEPLLIAKAFGEGRVFHTALGHDLRAMRSPGFMLMTARGTEWAATGRVTVTQAPRPE